MSGRTTEGQCGKLLPGRWNGSRWACRGPAGHPGSCMAPLGADRYGLAYQEQSHEDLVAEVEALLQERASRQRDYAASLEREVRAEVVGAKWQHRAEVLAGLWARTKAAPKGRTKVEKAVTAWAAEFTEPDVEAAS